MSDTISLLRKNCLLIKSRIAQACVRSGRNQNDVTIIPVTKYVDASVIADLVELGFHDVAENRWQVAEPKIEHLSTRYPQGLHWHFIGKLQSNKVNKVVGRFALIHSIDSLSLLEKVNQRAEVLGIRQGVLAQLRSGNRISKSGLANVDELGKLIEKLGSFPNIDCRGFMTMTDPDDTVEEIHVTYGKLRQLGEDFKARLGLDRVELSMGMSSDFDIAVEEGATLLRIGTFLYQGLPPSAFLQ